VSLLEDGEIKIQLSIEVEAPPSFETKTSLVDHQSGINEISKNLQVLSKVQINNTLIWFNVRAPSLWKLRKFLWRGEDFE